MKMGVKRRWLPLFKHDKKGKHVEFSMGFTAKEGHPGCRERGRMLQTGPAEIKLLTSVLSLLNFHVTGGASSQKSSALSGATDDCPTYDGLSCLHTQSSADKALQ